LELCFSDLPSRNEMKFKKSIKGIISEKNHRFFLDLLARNEMQ
jgi:hypothetical protein